MVKNGENVNSSIQKMYAVFFAFGKKKKANNIFTIKVLCDKLYM